MTVKLANFGAGTPTIAGVAHDATGDGTTLYASPEQLADDPCDNKTDVYSACLVLAVLVDPLYATKSVSMVVAATAIACYGCLALLTHPIIFRSGCYSL